MLKRDAELDHLSGIDRMNGALQRRRRPPLSGGSAGHVRVRQVDYGRPLSWLRP
jgi:hypothetical protein